MSAVLPHGGFTYPNALQMFPWRPKEYPAARLEGNKKAVEMVAYGMAVKVV
jgi:hypothetical protein